MENNGWIKLHRKILDNPKICQNSDYMNLWVHLLLFATHSERPKIFNGKNIILRAGQFITGRKFLSEATGINESKVERILKYLESEHQIEQQKTNINRLITIVKWGDYQESEQPPEQQVNNDRTTSEQRVNTYKNDKNDKNDRNDKKKVGLLLFEDIEFPETLNNEVFKATYKEWFDYRKEIKLALTKTSAKKQLKFLALHSADAVKIIDNSIQNSWKGLFELKQNNFNGTKPNTNGTSGAGQTLTTVKV